MADYVFDTEFVDKDDLLAGISIGIVCADDDREFYGINADMPQDLVSTGWLGDNVWPHLPQFDGRLDMSHRRVLTPKAMQVQLEEFFGQTRDNRLWAWYGAFDFVVLARMAGGFLGMGRPIPQFLWGDLRALYEATPALRRPAAEPLSPEYAHHPLHDARWALEIGRDLEILP